jgi:hypothetical protein
VVTLPAGSSNKGPFATASIVPKLFSDSERSRPRGSARLLTSVSVRFSERS